ncbi:MAG: hypothetical protein ACREYE_13235, partial [Gammaproteobacteria bacterium]
MPIPSSRFIGASRARRRTRERLSPIPEALWASAVGLAREHGLHKTAGALRLNYYTLKKHLESADGQA